MCHLIPKEVININIKAPRGEVVTQIADARLLTAEHRNFEHTKLWHVEVVAEHENDEGWVVARICAVHRVRKWQVFAQRFEISFRPYCKRLTVAKQDVVIPENDQKFPGIICNLCSCVTPNANVCTVCGANPTTESIPKVPMRQH